MIYTYTTFRYKKELISVVKLGNFPRAYDPSLFSKTGIPTDGTNYLCGPSETDRRWYAQVEVSDGCIVKVK
jgi:hypothetical protein